MTPDRWQQIEEVFHGALERRVPDRTEYLDHACSGDRDLRDTVERLLHDDEHDDGFLVPPEEVITPLAALELPAGQSIGPFELVRTIAVGGSASVFEARQQRPRRRVALKLPRLESTSPAAHRRFERECDILAHLRHPGIAQVYQAGVADGHLGKVPYFAMEFVEGARNLVEYSNAEGLSQHDRLSLVAQICDAVEHGHSHGIVHRDLKPGNLLVDADGRPKVIDFGVARVIGSEFRVTTMQTDSGQLLGTLTYMSPEQWRGDASAITPATDVYALGVVLYELVTGRLPHDLRGLSLLDAARVVENKTPARPAGAPDLEAVILTALDKDPARRYASAGKLAEDLRLFLDQRPVRARPPGRLRRLMMLVRRNRAAAAAAVLTLITGVFAALLVLNGSHAGRTEAAFREQAQRVTTLLQDVLRSAGPDRRVPDQAQLDMLAGVATQIESDFASFPDTEARLRMTLGDTHVALGLYDEAEQHLRRSHALRLELPNRDTVELAKTKRSLGYALVKTAHNEEAEALLREAVALSRTAGDDDTLAYCLSCLAECRMEQGALAEAEQHYRESAELTRELLGEHSERRREVLVGLATSQLRQSELDEAEALLRQLIGDHDERDSPEDLLFADSLHKLGSLLVERQRYRDAEALLERALAIMRRLQDADHPDIGGAMNALGVAHMQIGEHDRAERELVESIRIRRKRLGNDHPDLAEGLNNLGFLLKECGDYSGAEANYREALRIQEASIGLEHASVAFTLLNLATVLERRGDPGAAVTLVRRALRIRRQALGDEHLFVAIARNHLGRLLVSAGKTDEARPLLVEAEATARRVLGRNHWATHICSSNLARVERLEGNYDEAEARVRRAFRAAEREFGPASVQAAGSRITLADILRDQGRLDESETELRQAVETLRGRLPAEHPELHLPMLRLAVVLLDRGRPTDARPIIEELIAVLAATRPVDHWQLVFAQALLGRCETLLGRREEGEARLREAYAGLRAVLGENARESRQVLAYLDDGSEVEER